MVNHLLGFSRNSVRHGLRGHKEYSSFKEYLMEHEPTMKMHDHDKIMERFGKIQKEIK